ncbi:serine hydrolase [Carboxylicivirga sp. M1479]|uniref:serine hydrolase domain-containing protein n=1 Tax=Carboxylicivirga sp. M1479 TaxID=2594476 RepID=UPI001177E1A5|nr:serine hydrolase [Carboxylicivirga sp. M1479]TRX71270.1 serine hydrolase [Carboxylicivirga sp. M1479]
MKLLKKLLKVVGLLVLILFIGLGFVLYPLLRGATGYSAKMLCSGVFVEGMSQQQVEQMELTAFPFNNVVNVVDEETKTVKSSIFGLVSQTATYADGVGATLFPKGNSSINERLSLPRSKFDTLPWPQGSVLVDNIPQGVDVEGLRQFIDQQFEETSRAVVVVKDGQIIEEKYAEGINEFTPLLGWSMTKTITAALTGILVKEGKLDINDAADIEAWQNDERSEITLNNLLQMSSGLAWNEDYSKTQLTDVSQMLYVESDMYAYAISPEAAVKPDSIWKYSSGTTNIISGILRSCFNNYNDYYQFPQKALFNKLGMQHSYIETDATGTFVGSSYGYCSARDWARFGMLYLNKGNWMGEQLLPDWWVDYSTRPARASNGKYGAQLWLNASQIHMPDMPADVYFLNGYRGQRVAVMPSKNMVVVCLNSKAEEIDYNWYLNQMMTYVD